MRQEDRASLKRSQYQVFTENYLNPNSNFVERFFWGLAALALTLVLLLAVAVFAGAISWSSLLVVLVFLAVAFTLGLKS